ncbi:MAG: thermonuclease family protein [Salinibacterium sp.]|nr:thermonuclease family protein [Salinibacterium sp.]
MRKIVTLIVIVGLVVLALVGTQNGWFAGTGTTNPTSPEPAADSGQSADAIPPDATEAVVEYVHDGDTLFLTDGRKVRMLGINTPEIGNNLECYGDEATALLRSLLPEGTHVWVEQDVEPLDQYGRSLLFVYTDDGTNVNLELLREGAAEVEMYRPNVLFRDEIYAAQDSARAADLGLWGACN